MNQRWKASPACSISSVAGEQQPMITQIYIHCSIGFVLHLHTGNGNLLEANAIDDLMVAGPLPPEKIVHAASSHSSSLPLDWWKLKPI